MNVAGSADIARWVTGAGLAGTAEVELLQGFCVRVLAAGVPLAHANLLIDTLHPVHEGRVFRWRRDEADLAPVVEYGRTHEDEASADSWRRSPFSLLFQGSDEALRRRIDPDSAAEFPILRDLQEKGMTDYLALIHRFAADGVIGEMDCIFSSWATDRPSGFSAADLALLQDLAPSLALATKCASLARIAGTLVETYLGRDAGRRVLNGRIARGVAERISAVLWFSDLRGFTRITDASRPEEVIPLLNDYAEAIISSIHDAGGDVLKLIGDGTVAIFKADDAASACHAALAAEGVMRARVRAVNQERAARGLGVTEPYLGLHIGEVFYGNIGSRDRLDFTVVGPAVNETSRIATMCRSAERDVLISAAFRAAAREQDRARLVSVGRYALRGVQRPQELFTLMSGA